MTWIHTSVALAVAGIIMLLLSTVFFPWLFDSKQAEYHDQCITDYQNQSRNGNLSGIFSGYACMFGTQYPKPLPKPHKNVTIKSVQILWLGDCKVMTTDKDILYSSSDEVCMAQAGDVLGVYFRRTVENEITNRVYV